MPVDLQHSQDTCLPSHFQYDDALSHSQHHNTDANGSDLRSVVHSTQLHATDNDDDFIAQLTHHMDRFMLQDDDDDDKLDFSGIASHGFELSWDSIGSPQSTLWSPLGSNQWSSASEGSSQEASPPATPGKVMEMFDKMKLEERYHPAYEIQTSKSNIGLSSYQSLIQEQIRAIELSRVKQEHVLPQKQKQTADVEGEGQISEQHELPKEQIQQSQKKGKGRRTRPPRPTSLQHLLSQQQAGAGMRAMFLDGSAPRGGTGVFLPRATTAAPSQSTKKQGRGCSTVLIPHRVVQALQLHFDQMAATSGSKDGGFPPLYDALVSNKDGMYSLQTRQSKKAPAIMLPQEWTY